MYYRYTFERPGERKVCRRVRIVLNVCAHAFLLALQPLTGVRIKGVAFDASHVAYMVQRAWTNGRLIMCCTGWFACRSCNRAGARCRSPPQTQTSRILAA